MKFRRTLTLLYVTDQRVVRADVDLGAMPRLRKRQAVDRPASAGMLAAGVELALSLGGRPSKQTVLLTDDVWTQVVSVSHNASQGLSTEELEQLLKFESESYSELDPMNCQLGFRETESLDAASRQFWITAMPGDVAASLVQTVASRGGRLIHILHPAGETVAESPQASHVSVHGETGVALRPGRSRMLVSIRHSSIGARAAQAIDEFFAGQPPTVGVAGIGATLPSVNSDRVVSLDDESSLDAWLLTWAKQIGGGRLAVPTIKAPLPETSTKTRTQVGLVATLAAVALCGLHFGYAQWTQAALKAQIEAAKEPAAEKTRLDKEISDLKKQIEAAEKTRAATEADRKSLATVTADGDRFAKLLRQLASAYQETLVVDTITPTAKGQTLEGRSFQVQAADRLAEQLRAPLAPLGWAVHPASLEGENQLNSGGPWRFTIELSETEQHGPAVQDKANPAVANGNIAQTSPTQRGLQSTTAEDQP